MLRFDPPVPGQPAATPREAATVIPLRDGASGVEVFSVLRHPKSGFLGGALVFPGGKLEAADAGAAWSALTDGAPDRAEAMASPTAPALALAVAACREALEESGIFPAFGPDGPVTGEAIELVRAELAGGTPLTAAMRARGLRLATSSLVPFARWITPEAESRRFDARFFLLEQPKGQLGRADMHETTQAFWATSADCLRRAEAGEFFLAPPTARAFELLATCDTVAAAVALAARQGLQPICPRFVADDPPFLALPGDPAHDVRERRVDGPTRYVLRDGRFVAEDPH